jgi:hypothetical protein
MYDHIIDLVWCGPCERNDVTLYAAGIAYGAKQKAI